MKANQLVCAMTMMVSALTTLGGDKSVEAGLDWQYKGEKKYDKALVVWTDRVLIRNGDPIAAIEAARAAVTNLLMVTDRDTPWSDVAAAVTANYGLGTVVAEEAIPKAEIQRITHRGWYPISVTGWGFSILANLDKDGFVTEFAMNDIGTADIESRLIFTDGITVHESALTKYTVPSSIVVNEACCRTITEAVNELETCAKTGNLCGQTKVVLSPQRLEEQALKDWIKAHKKEYAFKVLAVDEEDVCLLKAATPPVIHVCKVEHPSETRSTERLKRIEVGIPNAVAGFDYEVLETENLGSAFTKADVSPKTATEDGELAFELFVPELAPNRFYKIAVISAL